MARRQRRQAAGAKRAIRQVDKAALADKSPLADKAGKVVEIAFLVVRTQVAMRKANAFAILDLSAMGNCASMWTNARNKPTIATHRHLVSIHQDPFNARVHPVLSVIHSWAARNVG
jgi:hypothetical protein